MSHEFYSASQLSSPQNCRDPADAAHVAELVVWAGDMLAEVGADQSGDGWEALGVPANKGGGWLVADHSECWAFFKELPQR